jgi:hypothetical protein
LVSIFVTMFWASSADQFVLPLVVNEMTGAVRFDSVAS